MRKRGEKRIKDIDDIGEMLNELDFMFIKHDEKVKVKNMIIKSFIIGKMTEVKSKMSEERRQRIEMAMERVMNTKYLQKN